MNGIILKEKLRQKSEGIEEGLITEKYRLNKNE